jgi:hypothetical protein
MTQTNPSPQPLSSLFTTHFNITLLSTPSGSSTKMFYVFLIPFMCVIFNGPVRSLNVMNNFSPKVVVTLYSALASTRRLFVKYESSIVFHAVVLWVVTTCSVVVESCSLKLLPEDGGRMDI